MSLCRVWVWFVIFLKLRPPPRSPLFPSTTLFRSAGGRAPPAARGAGRARAGPRADRRPRRRRHRGGGQARRSEEHTSELQSRQYLVCRLLLEKKNLAKIFGLRTEADVRFLFNVDV